MKKEQIEHYICEACKGDRNNCCAKINLAGILKNQCFATNELSILNSVLDICERDQNYSFEHLVELLGIDKTKIKLPFFAKILMWESFTEWRSQRAVGRDEKIVIWRYMSIEKWLHLLTTQEIIFSKISEFSDRNEVDYAVKLFEKNLALKSNAGLEGYIDSLKNDFFASCWNEKASECRSLWYAYTGNARIGVAIKSTVKNFYQSVKWPDSLPNCYRIAYDFPFSDPEVFQIVELPLYVKASAYDTEHEIRFLLNNTRTRFTQSSIESGKVPSFKAISSQPPIVKFATNLSILIDEVMVSPFATDWQKLAIEETSIRLFSGLSGKFIDSAVNE